MPGSLGWGLVAWAGELVGWWLPGWVPRNSSMVVPRNSSKGRAEQFFFFFWCRGTVPRALWWGILEFVEVCFVVGKRQFWSLWGGCAEQFQGPLWARTVPPRTRRAVPPRIRRTVPSPSGVPGAIGGQGALEAKWPRGRLLEPGEGANGREGALGARAPW